MENLKDQTVVQVLEQAIQDNDVTSDVANDVHVTIKRGTIILDGHVSSEEQMNTVANTATAVGVVDEVENHLEVTHKRE